MSTSKQQLIDRLARWFSNEVSGVKVPKQIISRLVLAGRVSSVPGFYRLSVEDFRNLDKVKPSVVSDLLTAIHSHGPITLDRVIYGLVIPGIDQEGARKLADESDSLDDFAKRAFNPLDSHLFGEAVGDKAILIDIQGWYLTEGAEQITEFQDLCRDAKVSFSVLASRKIFTGKKVYFRGRFPGVLQSELYQKLERVGAIPKTDTYIGADIVLLGQNHCLDLDALNEASEHPAVYDGLSETMLAELG